MEFRKEDGALLKEPSGSAVILLMSDWLETSRDIFLARWYLGVARRGAEERASLGSTVLLAPWARVLTNLKDTVPLSGLDSGKNIREEVWSKFTRWIDGRALNRSNTKNEGHPHLRRSGCLTHHLQTSCSTTSPPSPQLSPPRDHTTVVH